MPPSTRDLLASVLGELPQDHPLSSPAGTALPTSPPAAHAKPLQPQVLAPGPWRVTAKVSGGQVQISNQCESRVVPRQQVEHYLRGNGPARYLTN
jgi:hypothetical protein